MENVKKYWQGTVSPKLSFRKLRTQKEIEPAKHPDETKHKYFGALSGKIVYSGHRTDFVSFTDHEAYRNAFLPCQNPYQRQTPDINMRFQLLKLFQNIFNFDEKESSNTNPFCEGKDSISHKDLTATTFEFRVIKEYVDHWCENLTDPTNKHLKDSLVYLKNATVCLECPDSYIVANENFGKIGRHAMDGYDKAANNVSQKVMSTRLILFSLIMRVSYDYDSKTYTPFSKLSGTLLDMIGDKMLLMVDKLLTDIQEIKLKDPTFHHKEWHLYSVNQVCKFSFPFVWVTIREMLINPSTQFDLLYALNFIPEGSNDKVQILVSPRLSLYLWKECSNTKVRQSDQFIDWKVHSELASPLQWNENKICNMSGFFTILVENSSEEIEMLRTMEMPFIMNMCYDEDGDLFVHKACKNNSVFWVKRFISKSIAKSKGSDGKTLLHLACESGNIVMIELVIECVGEEAFEEKDDNLYTPIEYTAINLDTNVINYLIDNTDEGITLSILIKLPSILTAMMMSNKSDSATLECCRTFLEVVKRVRMGNDVYQEITKNLEGWDDSSCSARPATKTYIKNVARNWAEN